MPSSGNDLLCMDVPSLNLKMRFETEGVMFPFDFGFIPSTLEDDGDLLDILVLKAARAHVGCLIEVRVIGVITAEQIEDGNRETNNWLRAEEGHQIPKAGHQGSNGRQELSEPPRQTSMDALQCVFLRADMGLGITLVRSNQESANPLRDRAFVPLNP
jgi:hypothetical protein